MSITDSAMPRKGKGRHASHTTRAAVADIAPPYNLDAEQHALGAVMMKAHAADYAARNLTPNDFYLQDYRTIAEAAFAIYDRGESVNFISVVEELRAHDKLERLGGSGFVKAIYDNCPGAEDIQTYVDVVKNLSAKRKIALATERGKSEALNGVPAALVVENLKKSLDSIEVKTQRVTTFSASDLMSMKLADPKFAVPTLIAQGLGFIAGPPKIGKSWLLFALGIAVAKGGKVLGKIDVQSGDVLYLALEDNLRRLQDRMGKLLAPGEEAPDRLTLATEWPRIGNGCIEEIEQWLKEHKGARLVIIDTFQKIRPPRKRNAGIYEEDYEVTGQLKSLADKYGVAILAVHHLKKGESDDPLEAVNGSTGLVGAPDTLLILRRERGKADASLFVTGRDVEEQDLALEWHAPRGLWSLMGDAQEYRVSHERGEVIDLLTSNNRAMTPKEVSDLLGKPYSATKKLMWTMGKGGQLKALNDGKYVVGGNLGNSGNRGNSGDFGNPEADSDLFDA